MAIPVELEQSLVDRLRALGVPVKAGVAPEVAAIEFLVEHERYRRGSKDPVSGAYHPFALLQGSLMKDEYDLSTHGHLPEWSVGIVTADLVGTIMLNQRYGFEVGDRALKAMVAGLERLLPKTKVVRIHADAFAAYLVPSSELTIDAEMQGRVRDALVEDVTALLPDDGEPREAVQFTVSLVHLDVVKPSHWQVLGPLLWAEAQRAHTVQKLGKADGVQRRRVVLDGSV